MASATRPTRLLPRAPRVVAIGDIHGELEGFSGLLREVGLVDELGAWSGGDATLVQLGDFLDRGTEVRAVMDLLRRLQREAAAAGGEVVVLMGNHEGMNAVGALRDVSAEAVATFAGEQSEELRRRGLAAWEDWLLARARWRGDSRPALGEAERQAWLEAHPPGWIEYQQALGPEGEYGRWVRELPIAVVRAGTLFMHAGLSPDWAEVSPEEISARHHEAFAAYDRTVARLADLGLVPFWADRETVYETLVDLQVAVERSEKDRRAVATASPVVRSLFQTLARGFDDVRWTNEGDSPLWFRGYAQWPDPALAPHVDRVLAEQGVERLVAGHSPSSAHEVVRRLDDRVFLIDTGMLQSHYGGRASALVLSGDEVAVVYGVGAGGVEPAAEENGGPIPSARVLRDRNGAPLPFAGEDEIVAFLRDARIVESKPLNVGVTGARRLVLEQGGRQLRAVLHQVDRRETGPKRFQDGKTTMFFLDSYRSQVAAYELARLMGFRTVPPTVQRRVEGEMGSVQLWVEGASTWGRIKQMGERAPEPGLEQWQLHDMWVFDNLIGNTDRNEGNFLFDADWSLWWIDNTRAFSQDDSLPTPERIHRISLQMWSALRTIDDVAIREELSDVLSSFEVKALLRRRDRLVQLVEARIEAAGEAGVVFDATSPPPAVKVHYEAVN
jgi:hypothetical protein